MRKVLTILSLLVLAALRPALADGELQRLLEPDDSKRLESYEAVRAAALNEARAGGEKPDLEVLEEVLKGEPMSVRSGFDAKGDWRCRTIKVGGNLPLVVYGWFKCRIGDDGSGWRLEKLTGSQRSTGRLFDDGKTRMVYLGAGHYDYEKPRAYGSEAERDQVAYVFRPGKDRLRFEFPSPRFESKLDILDMRR